MTGVLHSAFRNFRSSDKIIPVSLLVVGGGGGGSGTTSLASLSDVSLSSLIYGDLLIYNASTGLWNNTHTLSGSYTLSGSLTTLPLLSFALFQNQA